MVGTRCAAAVAARPATRFEVSEPIRQGVRRRFGAFGPDVARGLAIRHDRGSHSMSDVFQAELRFLGIGRAQARDPGP